MPSQDANRRDIVVLGASAGGIPALESVFAQLPRDFAASLFVVLHLSPDATTSLDSVLGYSSALPISIAKDSEAIKRGHVYVATPDHHLILEKDCVRSIRGPKENWFRPSIDVLFRSAAYAFGPRVIGVVLSGMLDDGAAGLHAIKARGGLTIVQDPADARFPMMPEAALRHVVVDRRLPSAEIARVLMNESRKQAPPADRFPISKELECEVRIARQELDSTQLLSAVEALGARTTLTCPECHGTLWEIEETGRLRYRCHVGHAYSGEALAFGQNTILEEALWSATRALEEKVMLARRFAERLRARGLDRSADSNIEMADRFERQVHLVRELVLKTRDRSPQLEEDRV